MAERKFLDLSGLSTLWDAIKAKIPSKYASSKTEGGAADKAVSIPFGEVDSTSTSTAFTATVDGITELRDGVCVYLRNGVVTSASGCTLNINQLGAKPIYANNAAATGVAKLFASTYTMLFVYNSSRIDGGCWDMYYGYDSNTNTIGYQLRTNNTTLPMAQKVYRYRLLFTSADGAKWVGANTSTSTNATAVRTPNQTKIDPFGKIVYYGTTTAIDADASPGAAYLWSQYVATLGYSFNSTGAALVLDYYKPVYIKCAPQSDGSAIIDSTTPYVQKLPSTADGKIYIFLGIAVSETTVEMVPEHPVYCYRNGGIQLWTGIQQEIDAITMPSALSDLTNDVGYITSSAIPSNVSSFTNDVGFITSSEVPVTSVNGQTGAVTISAYDDTALVTRISAIESLESGWNAKQEAPLVGQINSSTSVDYLTPSMVAQAIGGIDNKDVYVSYTDSTYGALAFTTWNIAYSFNIVTANTIVVYNNVPLIYTLWGNTVTGVWDHDVSTIPTVPSNLSEYNNDVGFITSSAIPVTSVNGQTGEVNLTIPSTAADIGAIAAPANPSDGAILMYNATSSSWLANVMAVWSGGSY